MPATAAADADADFKKIDWHDYTQIARDKQRTGTGTELIVHTMRNDISVDCGSLPHNTQAFNGLWSETTWVDQYRKKHSPTYTHSDHQTSFINFFHLLQSIASSLFSLRT